MMFAMFNNLETWLSPSSDLEESEDSVYDVTPNFPDSECVGECSPENIVNTDVITVAVGLKRPQSVSLAEPIRFVLEHKQVSCLPSPHT